MLYRHLAAIKPRGARSACALAALLVVPLAAPATSTADSIVYLKTGNVWLTTPDGTHQRQVTHGGGWDSPSQADDGTILAAKGQTLVRMNRSGRVLGTPVTAVGGAMNTIPGESFKLFGPFDAEISPDGRQIAYWATAYNASSTGEIISTDWRDVSIVVPSDRTEPLAREDYMTSVRTPSWITNDRVLVAGSGVVNFSFQSWQPGRSGDYLQWWFRNVYAIEYDSELSPDGRKLVSVAKTNGLSSPEDTLHFFTVPGAAWTEGPYPATWEDDAVRPPEGELRCEAVRDSIVRSPSWSPASDAVAYEDGDGLWVADTGDYSRSCEGMREALIVPGGSDPDWGPADVGSASTPDPSGSPLIAVAVARQARRRTGLPVRLQLARPKRVTFRLCRLTSAGVCGATVVRKRTHARAGAVRVVLPLHRVAAGPHRLTVSLTGAATVVRTVQVR